VETDSLGDMKVPEDAYYAAQTARAVANFPISGLRFQREFIRALALVKWAAAKANHRLGLLDERRMTAIAKAALEVADGRLDDQFVVDVFQTGSGTSTNMNANEVIANRAIEILGGVRGDKKLLHPNDHVNMSQSTNDVFPTAINIAAAEKVSKKLLPSLVRLEKALEEKAAQFGDYVKSGRTHFQDAVPVTLGQEFGGYAEAIRKSRRRVERSMEGLLELPIGGTAVGTGLNAHPDFAQMVVDHLREATGLELRIADNRFEAMAGRDCNLDLSGALRTLAISLMRVCEDLRILSSGPNTGLAEVELPAVQPGSSIMPGKVNPVILESALMACCQVIGNDSSIGAACRLGELELNMGMPLIAYNLLQSIELLANTSRNLADNCIAGISANKEKCLQYAERSPALITAVAPVIGYDNAAKVAKKMLKTGKSIKEILVEDGVVEPSKIDQVIDLTRMTRGGILAK